MKPHNSELLAANCSTGAGVYELSSPVIYELILYVAFCEKWLMQMYFSLWVCSGIIQHKVATGTRVSLAGRA